MGVTPIGRGAGYQPFIDDPRHVRGLEGQRFVVLRAPGEVHATFRQVQAEARRRLAGMPASFPAQPHVTLCGFAAGVALDDVLALVRDWSRGVGCLSVEPLRVSAFPPPFQVLIVEVRKTVALYDALATLRTAAEHAALRLSTVVPVEQWTFHMSVAYGTKVDAAPWNDVVSQMSPIALPAVSGEVPTVEVVAFDHGVEHLGGEFALGAAESSGEALA